MTMFSAPLLGALLLTAGTSPMKEIQYGGGLATFSIPATWVAEREPRGGGIYYLDEPDSGTLRLTIQTYQKSDSSELVTSASVLSGMQSRHSTTVRTLPNGNSICEYVKHAEEDGEKLTLYWWQVANVVPPNHVRMASFSYTILSSQEGSDRTTAEVRILRSSIEAMRFATENGL